MVRIVAAQVIDMQRHLGVIREALKEFVDQVDVEFADQRPLERNVVLEPATQFDMCGKQELQHESLEVVYDEA